MNRCILIWPVQTHPFLHIYIYTYASLLSSVLVIYFVSNHSTSRAFRAHSSQILPNPLWNLPSQHFTNCIWQEEGSLLTIICTYIYYIYIHLLETRSGTTSFIQFWHGQSLKNCTVAKNNKYPPNIFFPRISAGHVNLVFPEWFYWLWFLVKAQGLRFQPVRLTKREQYKIPATYIFQDILYIYTYSIYIYNINYNQW